MTEDTPEISAEVKKDDAWIRTFTGLQFNFSNPHPDQVNIVDIAHSLSLVCRFTGHVREFYCVAEHCLWVSVVAESYARKGGGLEVKPPSEEEIQLIALEGLMHDAQEAYVTDLNKPAKTLLPEYQALEKKVWKVVSGKYGLTEGMHRFVKKADNTLLVAEAKVLLKEDDFSKWMGDDFEEDFRYDQIPMTPRQAERGFLTRFFQLAHGQFPNG